LQLIGAIREHYHISLPLAVLLSFEATFTCGWDFKIDLYDLARHNYLEHGGSLTHANAMPGGRYAPVSVNEVLLQYLLDVSKDPDFLSLDDLVTVRAARDATLSKPLSRFHNNISRGCVALTVQTFGDKDGNMMEICQNNSFENGSAINGYLVDGPSPRLL
jgi:Peroxidase, family 2